MTDVLLVSTLGKNMSAHSVNEYEEARLQRIARNRAQLDKLQVASAVEAFYQSIDIQTAARARAPVIPVAINGTTHRHALLPIRRQPRRNCLSTHAQRAISAADIQACISAPRSEPRPAAASAVVHACGNFDSVKTPSTSVVSSRKAAAAFRLKTSVVASLSTHMHDDMP